MNNFQNLFFTPAGRHTSTFIKSNLMKDLIDDIRYTSDRINYVKEYSHSKLYEKEGNIIYSCLAPSLEEKDIDVKIDDKSLSVKCIKDSKEEMEFNCFSNRKIKFKKYIEPNESFAKLEKGVLTVTMPIKDDLKMTSVKFI